MPSMLLEIRASGLARKSTAPSSRARITLLLSDREEMIRTGVGRSFISHRRNVKPSMFGISRSSVITSGVSRSVLPMASTPSTRSRPRRCRRRLPASVKGPPVERRIVDDQGLDLFRTVHGGENSGCGSSGPHADRLLIDHVMLQRAQGERGGNVDEGFRVSEQGSRPPELVVEGLDHLLLGVTIEVNDDISAENEVQSRIRLGLKGSRRVT